MNKFLPQQPQSLLKPSPSSPEMISTSPPESPASYLKSLLRCASRRRRQTWLPSLEDTSADYDWDSVRAIRANEVDKLREMLEEGKSFNVSNNNGESFLHLACRRGNKETIQFLVNEAHVDVDVCDNMGRTVLHDVCWRPQADTDIMEVFIFKVSPALLLAEDCRGHTCFEYCRKEHWHKWLKFLKTSADVLQRRADLWDKVCPDQ